MQHFSSINTSLVLPTATASPCFFEIKQPSIGAEETLNDYKWFQNIRSHSKLNPDIFSNFNIHTGITKRLPELFQRPVRAVMGR